MESSSPRPIDGEDLLVRRFVSGEAGANRLVERWAREILWYRRLNLGPEDVEDVVQEVVAGVWQAASRPGFEVRYGLKALVRRVTLARGIDRVRRLRVRRAEPLDEALPDTAAGPARLAELGEERERLYHALESLGEACRDLIRLHYFEDWSYARIAAIDRRNESTLRVRMFHCIRRLREQFGGEGGAGAR